MIALGGGASAHESLEPLLSDVDRLSPHPRNPRNGDTDVIIESIRVNGLYRPIYAQKSTGYILAGNHTAAAAMELGALRLPVIWLDVNNVEAERIMAVDNAAADLGRYDDALLLDLLKDLNQTDVGLLGSGYSVQQLDDLSALLDANSNITLGEFPEYDGSIETQHKCPSCGYEWSGTTGIGGPVS